MIDSNKVKKAEQMVRFLESDPTGVHAAGTHAGFSKAQADFICGKKVGGNPLAVKVWFDSDDNEYREEVIVDAHGAEVLKDSGALTKAEFIRERLSGTYEEHVAEAKKHKAALAKEADLRAAEQAEQEKYEAEQAAKHAAAEAEHAAKLKAEADALAAGQAPPA